MGFSLLDLESLTNLDGYADVSTIPVAVLGQGDTFTQAKGTTRRYGITLADPETQAPLVATFSDTQPLRAYIWEGADGPTAATPSVAWFSAEAAQIYLDVAPADLAPLAVQPYPVRVEVSQGGTWQTAWEGWCDVAYEPATAPTLAAFGSYQDMLAVGGDAIKQLLTASSRAGFLEERSRAWSYLRGVILARYRPAGGRWGGMGYAGGLPGYWVPVDAPNPVVAGYLDAGLLMVTPAVTEILARKACALLFDRQQDPQWRQLAAVEHLRADWLIAALVAGIDTNADGYPDITINCGIINTRDL